MLILSITTTDGPIHLFDKTTGEHIELRYLGGHGQARLGFTASKNIDIQRDKIFQAKEYCEGGNR